MFLNTLTILGPTATGKSDLAVFLAEKLNGEIISADSRQVYRGMDIGTGKITVEEMRGIPHHLIDVIDPGEAFSVVEYVRLAKIVMADIVSRGKLPIICGGTGFYIQALVDDVVLPEVSANEKLRAELAEKSTEELLKILEKLDPRRFATVDKVNKRRVIRAIEIASELGFVPPITGTRGTMADMQSKSIGTNLSNTIQIGLTLTPAELRERIDTRLLGRIESGMVDEVRGLHDRGLSWARLEEFGLEYRYLALHLQGKMTLEEMIEKLKIEIWRYAKRQMTWFKKDEEIPWFRPEQVIQNFKFKSQIQ